MTDLGEPALSEHCLKSVFVGQALSPADRLFPSFSRSWLRSEPRPSGSDLTALSGERSGQSAGATSRVARHEKRRPVSHSCGATASSCVVSP